MRSSYGIYRRVDPKANRQVDQVAVATSCPPLPPPFLHALRAGPACRAKRAVGFARGLAACCFEYLLRMKKMNQFTVFRRLGSFPHTRAGF